MVRIRHGAERRITFLGKSVDTWGNNVKADFKQTGCQGVDCIFLAQCDSFGRFQEPGYMHLVL
jgi:hypothetical protein